MRHLLLVLLCLLACCGDQPVSRPSQLPLWATNANYAGGPDIGTPTRVAIPSGRRADGWARNVTPPAQYQNEWQGEVGDWIVWFDSGTDVSLVALAARTDAVPGQKVYVQNLGWYMFAVAAPNTPDGIYIIDASVAMGGTACWIYENWAHYLLKQFPAIGPVPGDSFSNVTQPGKINYDIVPNGIRNYDILAPAQYFTSSGSNVTLATLYSHSLILNDILEFNASAWIAGGSAAAFNVQVWLEFSQDGGATWTSVTANGGALSIALTADNLPKALPLSFTRQVSVSFGVVFVRLRALSDGVHQLVVTLDGGSAKTYRP